MDQHFYKKAIEQYGGQRPAARALNMSFVSFKYQYRKQEGLCTRCGKKPEKGKICNQCNKEDKIYKSNLPPSISINKCPNCNKNFKTKYYRAKTQKFCSYSCRSQYNNKGINNPMYLHGEAHRKYPNAFYKARNLVLTRDNNACQLCHADSEESYDVHHIDYNKDNNDLSNLITLCKTCHAKTGGTADNRDHWQSFFKAIIPRSK